MTVTVRDDSVFSKPFVPKNSWQLLSWVIFKPILLQRYSDTLSKKQTNIIFLRAYARIILISFTLYLLCCFIVVVTDTQTLFPAIYTTKFVDPYRSLAGFEQKFFFIIQKNIITLIGLLAFVSGL